MGAGNGTPPPISPFSPLLAHQKVSPTWTHRDSPACCLDQPDKSRQSSLPSALPAIPCSKAQLVGAPRGRMASEESVTRSPVPSLDNTSHPGGHEARRAARGEAGTYRGNDPEDSPEERPRARASTSRAGGSETGRHLWRASGEGDTQMAPGAHLLGASGMRPGPPGAEEGSSHRCPPGPLFPTKPGEGVSGHPVGSGPLILQVLSALSQGDGGTDHPHTTPGPPRHPGAPLQPTIPGACSPRRVGRT